MLHWEGEGATRSTLLAVRRRQPGKGFSVHPRFGHGLPSEFVFPRFVAGMRALLAVVGAIGILGLARGQDAAQPLVLLIATWAYLLWSAVLMVKTLGGWRRASSPVWPWVDAAVLLYLSQPLSSPLAPLFGAATVLPVVAVALLGGARHGVALAVVSAATMLVLTGWHRNVGELPPWSLGIPFLLLALGPAAALLVQPSRELRQRVQLLERFNERSDPRQGLPHHVDVLLGLLAARLSLSLAVLSMRGPEPRIFLWRPGVGAQPIEGADLQVWRDRLGALSAECDYLSQGEQAAAAVTAFDSVQASQRPVAEPARHAMMALGPHALALPLQSYGQPLGHLCLARTQLDFNHDDLHWLQGLMREVLPLLERSDLLEQLQRESAASERERIGRDLHDSAVQPYIGLKYGLEALARRAGPDNAVWPDIQRILKIANDELQILRDVVGGLRSGHDAAEPSAPLAALQRQTARFEALYGLKVHVFASQALHLRGAAAKAMLHMVNEALTNVRRHTSATAVTVLIDADLTHVVMRLRNDHGPGERLAHDFVPRSITERATQFRGSVSVSHEQDFTEVAIKLPLLGAIG